MSILVLNLNLYSNMSSVLYNVFWFVRNFLYSFHMLLFMSVSGYLFYFEIVRTLDNSYTFASWVKEFLIFAKRKTLRLIVPFFVIMYCYRKPIMLFLGQEAINESGGFSKTVFYVYYNRSVMVSLYSICNIYY